MRLSALSFFSRRRESTGSVVWARSASCSLTVPFSFRRPCRGGRKRESTVQAQAASRSLYALSSSIQSPPIVVRVPPFRPVRLIFCSLDSRLLAMPSRSFSWMRMATSGAWTSSLYGCAGTPQAASEKVCAATRASMTYSWGASASRHATTPGMGEER